MPTACLPALKLIHDYLSNRQQRTNINHDFSSWGEVLFGVPQGCVLGPILFNIFLSDLFLVMKETEFTSYADDNTLHDASNTIEDVISSLQESPEKLFKWFSDNQMQGNSGKCHLILSTSEPAQIQIGESLIESTNCEKLLGVKIDSKLSFDKHIKTICKKASNKLRALARVTPYMSIEKKKILMNSFFDSQFNYCLLVWMCYSRRNNTKINNLHERCLRLIYSDKKSFYEEVLGKDGSVSIHHRKIQALATEIYKVKSGQTPKIFSDLFNQREISPYNLRRQPEFRVPLTRTMYDGSESISYLGPKTRDILPTSFKEEVSLNSFKKVSNKWVPKACPCRLCKNYIPGTGFVESLS